MSGIPILDGFEYKGKSNIDKRKNVRTMADALLLRDIDVPEGFVIYVEDEDKYYSFSSSNSYDKTTGKWRRLYVSGDEQPYMEGSTLVLSKSKRHGTE